MAVKVVWVLTSIWSVHNAPEHHYLQFASHDECRDAAIQAIEVGGAKFAFCTEGYATPLQYLPYER
jgi:hypothetical protein